MNFAISIHNSKIEKNIVLVKKVVSDILKRVKNISSRWATNLTLRTTVGALAALGDVLKVKNVGRCPGRHT